MGGAREARPTPSRLPVRRAGVRMARGSVSAAMIFILPPHAGHSEAHPIHHSRAPTTQGGWAAWCGFLSFVFFVPS